MNFKKWVKSIQTAGYNGARTVYILVFLSIIGENFDLFYPFSYVVCTKNMYKNLLKDVENSSVKCLRATKINKFVF